MDGIIILAGIAALLISGAMVFILSIGAEEGNDMEDEDGI